MKDLYLLYALLDPMLSNTSLAGVFVEYDNAVRCRDVLLARKSDLVCWIVRCKSDRLINSFAIFDATR